MPAADPDERRRISQKGVEARAAARQRRRDAEADAEPPQSIDDYDRLAGLPSTWADVKKREEAIGELTLNETRRISLEQSRIALQKEKGLLIPKATGDLACRMIRDAIAAQLTGLGGRLVQRVDGLAPDIRQRIAEAAELEINAALDRAQEQAAKKSS